MTDNRTMAQMLQDPIEGYEDAIVVPPIKANNFELKQTLINLVQSNQFTGRQDPHNHLRLLNQMRNFIQNFQSGPPGEDKKNEETTDTELLSTEDIHPLAIQEPPRGSNICQLIEECCVEVPEQQKQNMEKTMFDLDALDSAAGGNLLDKIPRECLSIIESKSKIAAAPEDKLDIRMNRFKKSLNEMKNSFVTPTAPLKAVTEVCVTCGSNHNYNQCPLTRGGNDFPVCHDNIQQFQTAAVGNFIQNRQNVSNQIRPPGFHQPTQQNNNQNRFQSNNLNQNPQPNQGAIYQNRLP
nr:hypothetical protein [Tanacetum cinerariifolium]